MSCASGWPLDRAGCRQLCTRNPHAARREIGTALIRFGMEWATNCARGLASSILSSMLEEKLTKESA